MTIYSNTGRHVQHAITRALEEARARGGHVGVSHNGVEFTVYPDDSVESALTKFHRLSKP